MDNLSAQQKLMGNMQATSEELLSGIMEERGRGFASDREAWAQLKENIENVESRMKAIKDVHKDMWSAVKDHNGDAFCALAGEFQRSAILLAMEWTNASVLANIAVLLALLKIARIATGHGKSDNWVDLAGYAACGGELQSRPAVCGK